MRRNVKQSISDMLEIPSEVLLNLPLITMTGKGEIDIENYKSILEYSDTYIAINTSIGMVCISGKNLELKSVTLENITIRGDIFEVVFK